MAATLTSSCGFRSLCKLLEELGPAAGRAAAIPWASGNTVDAPAAGLVSCFQACLEMHFADDQRRQTPMYLSTGGFLLILANGSFLTVS